MGSSTKISNEMLTYVLHHMQGAAHDNVKNALVSFYDLEAFATAKKALLECYKEWPDTHLQKLGKRRNSSSRTKAQQHAEDILCSLSFLDTKGVTLQPSFDLGMIPSIVPEELNTCSMLDRIRSLENKCAQLDSIIATDSSQPDLNSISDTLGNLSVKINRHEEILKQQTFPISQSIATGEIRVVDDDQNGLAHVASSHDDGMRVDGGELPGAPAVFHLPSCPLRVASPHTSNSAGSTDVIVGENVNMDILTSLTPSHTVPFTTPSTPPTYVSSALPNTPSNTVLSASHFTHQHTAPLAPHLTPSIFVPSAPLLTPPHTTTTTYATSFTPSHTTPSPVFSGLFVLMCKILEY